MECFRRCRWRLVCCSSFLMGVQTMSREKQIEEMAQDIENALPDYEHNARDCRDAAEELYNAGYRKQSEPFSCGHEKGDKWISVEDRLPEESGWYLVNIITPFDLEFISLSHYSKGYGWKNSDTVTHWMPLPEAPKGGAE